MFRFPLATLAALLLFPIAAGIGQDLSPAERDAAVAKARVYLADFDRFLDTDDEKAQEAFAVFLEMPGFIQEGLNRHLETKWTERLKAYQRAAGFSASSRSGRGSGMLTGEDLGRARELQRTLADIRSLGNENEMKKALKETGWPSLQALGRIYKPSSFRRESGSGSGISSRPADPTAAAKRVAALKVGVYRERLRKHLGRPLELSPEHEVDGNEGEVQGTEKGGDDAPPAAEMRISASERSVLRQNAALFREIESAEAEGIRQLNEWRIMLGLNPLIVDPKLCAAARDHSKDMASHGFFSHTSPIKGKASFGQRARNFGTSARAENIAINGSPAAANQAWFYSPGHHKNMFANHTHVGLGINGRHYTQMFR